MKTVAKVRILAIALIHFFLLYNLSSQTFKENPLIKCMYGNQREYQIFKGDKLFIKLKTNNSKNSSKVDRNKIYTLEHVNNKQLFLKDYKSSSKIYSQEEIYSIQRIEEKKEKNRKTYITFIIFGALAYIIGAIFTIVGINNALNDDLFSPEKKSTETKAIIAISGLIIGSIFLYAGLLLRLSSKQNYTLIDKEIVFQDPECKCEYYTLP
jgi:hypothetical protein